MGQNVAFKVFFYNYRKEHPSARKIRMGERLVGEVKKEGQGQTDTGSYGLLARIKVRGTWAGNHTATALAIIDELVASRTDRSTATVSISIPIGIDNIFGRQRL